jgi:hypothetical protein
MTHELPSAAPGAFVAVARRGDASSNHRPAPVAGAGRGQVEVGARSAVVGFERQVGAGSGEATPR